jgi:hypothetical protein
MAIQNQSCTTFLQFEKIIDVTLTTIAPNRTAVLKQWLDACIVLEVTIARKVLPHPQWIKASMRNLLNKGLFI